MIDNNNDNKDDFKRNFVKQRPRRMINVSFPSAKYGLFFAIIVIAIVLLLELLKLF